MVTGTISVLLDLDEDGTCETEIGPYVDWDQSFQAQGMGSAGGADRASVQSLTIHVKNDDGRFSPKNAAGPYYPALRGNKPFGVQVQVTFDSVTYDVFTGRVWDVVVNRDRESHEAWLDCRDRSDAFARAEITLPIMTDIETGTMVHRVLDLYEGELAPNPRFVIEDLTLHYEETAGAAPTRVAEAMEGQWAMEKVASANLQGYRAILDSATAAGVPYELAVYVWRGSGEATPSAVRLYAGDDIHGLWPTVDTTLAEGRWNRLPYSVTFDPASTNRDLYVLNNSGGAATFRTGAVHVVALVDAAARRIDAGKSKLSFNSYQRVLCGDAVDEIRVNELGARFYFAADGAAVFEDQHHRWRETHSRVSQATFDHTYAALHYRESAESRVSKVIYDYPEWEEGTPGEDAWGLFPVPQEIPPKVGSVKGELRIPIDHQGGLVRDAIRPVANEDWFVEDAAGADASVDIELQWEHFGGGALAVLLNDSTIPGTTLTSFKYRGTTVRLGSARKAVEYTPAVAPRENLPHAFRYTLNADRNRLTAWAQYIGNRHGPQLEEVGLEVDAPWPVASQALHVALAKEVLSRGISDRITVKDTKLPWSSQVNGDYWIESVDWTIEGERIGVSWTTSPVDGFDFLVLDVGQLDIDRLA